MLTEEQRKLRQSGIGASDVGAILGFNKYKTPLEVYFDKVKPLPPEGEANEKVLWGNLLEPVIADRYAAQNNCELLLFPTTRHHKYPYIMCTPDRLIKNSKKGIEIKTVGHEARRASWQDNEIPKHYFMQVHHCMFVLDYNEWDLVVLFEGQEMQTFNFKRDPDFDAIIVDACTKFWTNHVEKQIPPPVDFEKANSLELIKKVYNEVDKGSSVELEADLLHWVETWQKAKEEITKYTWAANTAQSHILGAIGNNSMAYLPNGDTLVRKEVKKKGFTVEPSSYVTLSYKKSK